MYKCLCVAVANPGLISTNNNVHYIILLCEINVQIKTNFNW